MLANGNKRNKNRTNGLLTNDGRKVRGVEIEGERMYPRTK